MNEIDDCQIARKALSNDFVCVFPGSGSQYVGMGKSLYKDFKVAENIFLKANEVLGYDITRICFNGGIVELNRIKNSLLAVYIASVAYFEVLKSYLPHPPRYLAGHSLGEYSALTCAGVISFEEGLKIVQKRAQLAEEVKHIHAMGMTIVKGVAPIDIERMCQEKEQYGHVSIGCYNSCNQVLLTGHEQAIQKVEEEIHRHFSTAQLIPLFASPAFHSPLLQEAAEKLRVYLNHCHWGNWKCPIVSNVTGLPYQSKEQAIDHLIEQLYKPVQWMDTMNFIAGKSVNAVIEVGPQTILKQLKQNFSVPFYSLDDPKDRKFIFQKI